MLNPEFCDYNAGRIKLGFTDDDANHVLTVYLSEDDAWKLHEMIMRKCNMKAKENRTNADETPDYHF